MSEAITAIGAVSIFAALGRGLQLLGLRHARAAARAAAEPVVLLRVANPLAFRPPQDGDPDPIIRMKLQMGLFVVQAFANPDHPDAQGVLDLLAERADDPNIAVFVTRRGARPTGLAIVSGYVDAFNPHPWVQHFYAPGDRESRETLSRAIAEWAGARGHAYVAALNRTGHSDRRWFAAHRRVAGGFRVVASYGLFEVPKEARR